MEDVIWEMNTKPRKQIVLRNRDAKAVASHISDLLDIQFLLSITDFCYTDKSKERSGC